MIVSLLKTIGVSCILSVRLTFPASAGDFDSFLSAESETELLDVLVRKGEIQSLDMECKAEMTRGAFPESCMKALTKQALRISDPVAWKQAWRLHSKTCVKTAVNLQSLKKVRHWSVNEDLSKDCRHALDERQKDLEYILE